MLLKKINILIMMMFFVMINLFLFQTNEVNARNIPYATVPADTNDKGTPSSAPKAPKSVTSSTNEALTITVGNGMTIGKTSANKSFNENGSTKNLFSELFIRGELLINILAGIISLTFIALFIFKFLKLGATAANPQARSQVLQGLLWLGIAVMLSGSISIFLALSYNAFK